MHLNQLATNPFSTGPGGGLTKNFTYKAVRAAANELRGAKKYVTWCDGQRELYDLGRDPFEVDNIFRTSPAFVAAAEGRAEGSALEEEGLRPQLAGGQDAAGLQRMWDRLDALVGAFYDCKVRTRGSLGGASRRDSWLD